MKNEKGFSLIEVVIALLLLGIIGVALLGGLATASMALLIADERATAESLARSQMESIKSQDYINHAISGHEDYNLITPPTDYIIEITAVPFDPDTRLPFSEDEGVFEEDLGIQKITVTISHHDKVVIALENYKVNR